FAPQRKTPLLATKSGVFSDWRARMRTRAGTAANLLADRADRQCVLHGRHALNALSNLRCLVDLRLLRHRALQRHSTALRANRDVGDADVLSLRQCAAHLFSKCAVS